MAKIRKAVKQASKQQKTAAQKRADTIKEISVQQRRKRKEALR